MGCGSSVPPPQIESSSSDDEETTTDVEEEEEEEDNATKDSLSVQGDADNTSQQINETVLSDIDEENEMIGNALSVFGAAKASHFINKIKERSMKKEEQTQNDLQVTEDMTMTMEGSEGNTGENVVKTSLSLDKEDDPEGKSSLELEQEEQQQEETKNEPGTSEEPAAPASDIKSDNTKDDPAAPDSNKEIEVSADDAPVKQEENSVTTGEEEKATDTEKNQKEEEGKNIEATHDM